MKNLYRLWLVIIIVVVNTPLSAVLAMGGPSVKEEVKASQGSASKSPPQSSHASEVEKTKAYIAIKGPTFKGLMKFPREEILKIAIDEIMKTQKFEFIFSSPKNFREATYLYFELHLDGEGVKWGDGKHGLNLHFYLFNTKTGKLVTKVSRERVENKRLLFTVRHMLLELFFGKEVAKKKANKINEKGEVQEEKKEEKNPQPIPAKAPHKEAAPKDKKKDNKEEPEKEKLKKPGVKIETKKLEKKKAKLQYPTPKIPKLPNDEEKNPPPEDASDEDSSPASKSEEDTAAIPPKPVKEERLPKIPPSADELSEEINKEISNFVARAKKNKIKLGEDPGAKEEKKDEKKDKKEEGESGDLDLLPQAVQPKSIAGGPGRKALKSYSLAFDVIVQQVNSRDLISVTNTFTYLGINATASMQFDPASLDKLHFNFRYTQTVEAGDYEVPGMKQLGINYQKYIFNLPVTPIIGLEYETQSFVNLNTAGGGLKVNENKIIWYRGALELNFGLWRREFFLSGALAKSFAGSTNYGGNGKSVTIDGTKAEFSLRFEMFKKLFLQMTTSTARMQSQGIQNLVNEQTTTYVGLVYPI